MSKELYKVVVVDRGKGYAKPFYVLAESFDEAIKITEADFINWSIKCYPEVKSVEFLTHNVLGKEAGIVAK